MGHPLTGVVEDHHLRMQARALVEALVTGLHHMVAFARDNLQTDPFYRRLRRPPRQLGFKASAKFFRRVEKSLAGAQILGREVSVWDHSIQQKKNRVGLWEPAVRNRTRL